MLWIEQDTVKEKNNITKHSVELDQGEMQYANYDFYSKNLFLLL